MSESIKTNWLPIAAEIVFILCCLAADREYFIYINFSFYALLALYFCIRKDLVLKEWLDSLKSGRRFWKQVLWTLLSLVSAFVLTSLLENAFPHLDKGMILLKADNAFELILFIGSTILFPAAVEETFYRKNLISFQNRTALLCTALFSMFLYALEHALTIWGIFLCMIWALPLSISYIKTKNIHVAMTAHFICNLLMNGITAMEVFCFLLN
ncbi:MAG: CPBP family intramembrane metalloprotease [Peptostreptococcaceae bacterium]|nr:CPBP family intramembrane metalloprotease [Peptostreptococcaceae bacterium]